MYHRLKEGNSSPKKPEEQRKSKKPIDWRTKMIGASTLPNPASSTAVVEKSAEITEQ
jgi:hypothetical protein